MSYNNFAITELDRRLSNILRIGKVKEVDTKNAKLKVIFGEIETDFLPWLTIRAGNDRTWWSPDIGEQVLILSPSGDLAQGVAIPALYQQAYPSPENNMDISAIHYDDGSVIRYDKINHHLEINVIDKISINVSSSKIEITPNKITLNSNRIELN